MPEGYDNPATKGDGGDRAKPNSKKNGFTGAKGGNYDNSPNDAPGSPQAGKQSTIGKGAPTSGYDDTKLREDFGFSGSGKKSKGY